jgi:tetratricopeptide (TPR) repeat protein
MNDEPAWHSRWQATHDAMATCFRERRFTDAAEIMDRAREQAIAENSLQEAASYSGFLSTCLAILGRHRDAFDASEAAERLDPTEPHYTLRSVDLLVNYLSDPGSAWEKVSQLLSRVSEDDPSRYHALSLLGQAKLALGDSLAAIALFREIASQEMMERLRRAEYAGVYDLGLVHALIKKGLVAQECRHYLRQIHDVALTNGNTHVVADLERLMAKISSPA